MIRAAPSAFRAAWLVAALVVEEPVQAYPWMIRHEYNSCLPCHAEPTGAGLLTDYGRAQGDVLLQTSYAAETVQEPAETAGFLWGIAPLPEWLLLGGSARELLLSTEAGAASSNLRFVQMVLDLRGQVTLGSWRVNGSLGYAHEGARAAAITRTTRDNLIAREYWVGYDLDPEQGMLLYAGRINVPFGIRTVEHTLWARSMTRTSLNADQQHGVAFAWSGETYRAAAMAILGNYQLRPDDFRERGYSVFIETTPASRLGVGLSSLGTYAERDLELGTSAIRSAHGPFLRYSPWQPLVILLEADALVRAPTHRSTMLGVASFLMLDYEPLQGVHAMLTGELARTGETGAGTSLGAWATAAWFFAPHVDVRLDAIQQRQAIPNGSIDITALLAQLHVYL